MELNLWNLDVVRVLLLHVVCYYYKFDLIETFDYIPF